MSAKIIKKHPLSNSFMNRKQCETISSLCIFPSIDTLSKDIMSYSNKSASEIYVKNICITVTVANNFRQQLRHCKFFPKDEAINILQKQYKE